MIFGLLPQEIVNILAPILSYLAIAFVVFSILGYFKEFFKKLVSVTTILLGALFPVYMHFDNSVSSTDFSNKKIAVDINLTNTVSSLVDKKVEEINISTVDLTLKEKLYALQQEIKNIEENQSILFSQKNEIDKLRQKVEEEFFSLQKALVESNVIIDYEENSTNKSFGNIFIYNEDRKAKMLKVNVEAYMLIYIPNIVKSINPSFGSSIEYNYARIFKLPFFYKSSIFDEKYNISLNIFENKFDNTIDYTHAIYKYIQNKKGNKYNGSVVGNIKIYPFYKITTTYSDILKGEQSIEKYIAFGYMVDVANIKKENYRNIEWPDYIFRQNYLNLKNNLIYYLNSKTKVQSTVKVYASFDYILAEMLVKSFSKGTHNVLDYFYANGQIKHNLEKKYTSLKVGTEEGSYVNLFEDVPSCFYNLGLSYSDNNIFYNSPLNKYWKADSYYFPFSEKVKGLDEKFDYIDLFLKK